MTPTGGVKRPSAVQRKTLPRVTPEDHELFDQH